MCSIKDVFNKGYSVRYCKIAILALLLNSVAINSLLANTDELNNTIKHIREVDSLEVQPEKKQEGDLFGKFKGKPVVKIFTDYTQGLFDNNENSGFELKRALFGYEGEFAKGFEARFEVDFGATKVIDGEKQYATYVRNAEVIWTKNRFNIHFGMLAPKVFNYVEEQWRYRYIAKTGMDEYGFASSRDLGVVINYDLFDWLVADFAMVNGGGYKNISFNNNHRYSLGATATFDSGFRFRVFGELYDKDESVEYGRNQSMASVYLGYENSKFMVSAEYDYMWNTDFLGHNGQSILSFYGCYNFTTKYNAFARYDKYQSRDNWNDFEDAYYLGFEYIPVKYVRLAPTYSCKKGVSGKLESQIGLFLYLKY